MSKPLQFGDPGELGRFRLESRLHESAAGIVYLASDPDGRLVEVALLTTAAAGDAAARDRFRAAVAAEAPRRTVRSAAPEGVSPVVAAVTEGGAPWVATEHVTGRSGAERFLKPVLMNRGWGMGTRRRGGPQFQPYWQSGPRAPALRAAEAPVTPLPPGAMTDTKGLAAAVLSLAALLVLLAFLVLLLFSCEPSDPVPQPTDLPTYGPSTDVPQPAPTTPRPTPRPSGTITPRPRPTDGDTVNPAGR
jgi:hypothetical protein